MSSISNLTIRKMSKVLAVYNCRITISQILTQHCTTYRIFKLHLIEITDPYSKNITHVVKLWPLLLYWSMDCMMYATCMQPNVVQTACRHLHADCSFRLHFRMRCTWTACSPNSCTARSADCSRPSSTAAQPWMKPWRTSSSPSIPWHWMVTSIYVTRTY